LNITGDKNTEREKGKRAKKTRISRINANRYIKFKLHELIKTDMKNYYIFAMVFWLCFTSCKKMDLEQKRHTYSDIYETGVSEDIDDLNFCDKENGLCITNPPSGNGTILKTTDGGKTWSKVTCPALGQLSRVQLFKSNVAYLLCDTILLKSIDGGTSWHVLKTGNIGDVHFTSDVTGYGIYQNNKVMKTVDGGLNWSAVYNSTTANTNYLFRYISCPDDITIYVCGWTTSARSIYFKSVDGGATWQTMNNFTSAFSNKMIFYTSTSGFVFLSQDVLKTTDGGISWAETSAPAENGIVNDIYMANENIGFALSNTKSFSTTNDGGQTWREPFMEERTEDGMDFKLRARKIIGFSDRTFYIACDGGKFAVVNAYNFGE
jgi:photosystem II stability/assembly factor-like uncharacterized protein